jgi:uncharacterized protein YxjI
MGMFDLDKYIIEYKLATVKFALCVKDSTGNLLGYIKHKGGLLGLPPNFLFEDTSGTLLGEIDRTKGSFVPLEYEVKDQSGQLVARIRFTRHAGAGSEPGRVWRFARWWMEDPQGQPLFTSGKTDWKDMLSKLGEHIIITADGSPIAQLHRKWVTTRDSFSIEILRQDFNPFLILSYVVLIHDRAHSR